MQRYPFTKKQLLPKGVKYKDMVIKGSHYRCLVCGNDVFASIRHRKDICNICGEYVPDYISSIQAKEYVNKRVYKKLRHKLVYKEDGILTQASYDFLANYCNSKRR